MGTQRAYNIRFQNKWLVETLRWTIRLLNVQFVIIKLSLVQFSLTNFMNYKTVLTTFKYKKLYSAKLIILSDYCHTDSRASS